MGQLLQFSPKGRLTASFPVRPQTVADLLLALEESPLAIMQGVIIRRFGRVVITARTPCGVFELSADEARLAAHALFSEQAFIGCIEASAQLMDLARTADGMRATAGAA